MPLYTEMPARANHVHLDDVDSTNAWTLARAADLPAWTVVTATRQTAGRGRQGRSWEAPTGNLAVSILCKPPHGAAGLAAYPLAAAVGACDALRDAGVADAWIKWPNDILAGTDRKLVGILIEVAALPSGGEAVVIGIGVNLSLDAAACAAIDRPASSVLLETGTAPDAQRMLITLLRRLFDAIDLGYNIGLAELHHRWAANSRLVDRVVTVTTAQGPLTGVVDALNADGSLALRLPDGTVRTLLAGDVSLRH